LPLFGNFLRTVANLETFWGRKLALTTVHHLDESSEDFVSLPVLLKDG
jgi:hypothetical protein